MAKLFFTRWLSLVTKSTLINTGKNGRARDSDQWRRWFKTWMQIWDGPSDSTLYHTITTFNDPDKDAFWKHCGKGENAGNQHFLLFPTIFSTLPKRNFSLPFTFILSFENAFNLDRPRPNGSVMSVSDSLRLRDPVEAKFISDIFSPGSQHFLLFPLCYLPCQIKIPFIWAKLKLWSANSSI